MDHLAVLQRIGIIVSIAWVLGVGFDYGRQWSGVSAKYDCPLGSTYHHCMVENADAYTDGRYDVVHGVFETALIPVALGWSVIYLAIRGAGWIKRKHRK
jgi:hypothetical protein